MVGALQGRGAREVESEAGIFTESSRIFPARKTLQCTTEPAFERAMLENIER